MLSLSRTERLPWILGAVVCTVMTVATTYSIAQAEFTQSLWAVDGGVPPAITVPFRDTYSYTWFTAAPILVWGTILFVRKESSIAGVGWFLAITAVHWAFWLYFTLLALYLANQTFRA